jgi:hypothetical protein
MWDIMLQCTICGFRQRRCRKDGNPPFGDNPPATCVTECTNCSASLETDVVTDHFVDFITEKEQREYPDD